MPIYSVPPDALWSSSNVCVRDGFLQTRPGLTQRSATVMDGRPTGIYNAPQLAEGAFQTDTFENPSFQVTAGLPGSLLMVGTTTEIYGQFGTTLTNITGGTLTAGDTQVARFTAISLAGVIYVIHANGKDAPIQWDATTAAFGAMVGAPATWTDVTNIAEHIIGIVPPFNISWGDSQAINSWPAANTRVLSDTPDVLRAIASLGVRTGVVYKSNSLWDVVVTGSETESEFFRFEMRGEVEGPSGPAAVVNANGAHVYMTDTGRVGYYNGSRHFWVADGIWPLIQADMDPTAGGLTFGAYDPLHRAVVFVYQRAADAAGICKGWAMVMLPNPAEGYNDFIAFHGESEVALSAGGSLRFNEFKGLFATSTAGAQRLYTWDGADDAGTAISGHLQTGLVPSPGLEFFAVDAYETLALRGTGYGTLTVKPVSSYILDTEGGTVGSGKTLDLATSTVLGGAKGGDIRGRFFGLRYEFTTPVTLKWLGARLAAKLRKG